MVHIIWWLLPVPIYLYPIYLYPIYLYRTLNGFDAYIKNEFVWPTLDPPRNSVVFMCPEQGLGPGSHKKTTRLQNSFILESGVGGVPDDTPYSE